jgi:hypothetical protein
VTRGKSFAPFRRYACVVVAASPLSFVSAAEAQGNDADRAAAESLFETGRKLMTEKKYAEACPKLAESFRLDPTTGTLLNLAVCHRDEGKIASAWAEFKDAASLARRDGRSDREQFAQEQSKTLEPRLPRLTITVAADAEAEGLSVSRDGSALPKPVWGVPIAVDPGDHVVMATAPGRVKWEASIQVAEREAKIVAVPVLQVDSNAAAGTAPAGGVAAPAGSATPVESGPAPAAPSENQGKRIAAYAALGLGAVGLGVGAFFGIDAMSKKSESDDNCTPGCNQTAVDLSHDARTAARISTVGFGVGLVGAGVGTWLLLTSGGSAESARAPRRALYVDPIVASDALAFELGGTW